MKYLLMLTGLMVMPSFAAGDLAADDMTGVSFWLVTAALLAATVFFFVERDNVSSKWKTSLTVSGLVTGIAFWHYMYMRGVWVDTQTSPIVYRYIDWLLTVPLLIVEFYLILRAVTNVASSLFTKLFVGSLVMLIFGYLGEAGNMNAMVAFVIAMLAWLYMIQVLYSGEGAAAAKQASPAVQTAYKTMMLIIVVGWAVYPLGYVLGHLVGDTNPASLNIVYNFADFVNKILFGLIIWHAAVTESQGT
ncbi:MAG: biphenyl 2,3-dioxygenase [Gammaproteobacteria bacterium]|jgi:bacteriorhodopsin|nr:biphenyl 2,3-dioxygenase [Gammaproteobacteria bacterium]